jgi:hypothetical protein
MCTPRAHHVHTGEGPGSPGSSVFLMCMCVCVCVRACVRVSVSVHADLECTQRTLIIAPPPNEPSPLPDPTPYASCHRKADRRKLLTALGPQADRRKLSLHIRLPCEDCGPRAFGFKGRDSQWPSKCFEFSRFACKPKAGTMVPVLALPFHTV